MIPDELQELLQKNGTLARAVGAYVATIQEILSDNKLPFFPDYTDHGINHVSDVLATEVRLIPKALWQSGFLTAEDAAVIILATALHDLAMHLRETGFLSMKSGDWPDRNASAPHTFGFTEPSWPEEWHGFHMEATRFDDQTLTRLLGPRPPSTDDKASPTSVWGYRELQDDPSSWNKYQLLIIGEFVRRHHGRLAHEFALFGFPGLPVEEFPTLLSILPFANKDLADIAGLVARSHSMLLRDAADELSLAFPGLPQPAHCFPVFHMALLRVADYLQIEHGRASPILLHLRHAASRQSVNEWNKHRAVRAIDWAHDDPQALHVTVEQSHGLLTHLQLRDLFDAMQKEMDQSAAVLAETYGARGDKYQWLRLDKSRVRTSFDDSRFLDSLEFVPKRVAFTTASAELLKLMIRPLYGDYPEIGVRELLQNAIDAVREIRVYLANHADLQGRLGREPHEPEVRVHVHKDDDDQWWCTVEDQGIGMTPDTVCNYFLRAGASLRVLDSWKAEFSARRDVPGVLRSGRFGVGALAAFLLGEEVRVETRHVSEDRGLSFRARIDDDVICLDRIDMSVGTTIRIPISCASVEKLRIRANDDLESIPEEMATRVRPYVGERDSWDWYCGNDVSVERRWEKRVLGQKTSIPGRGELLPKGWRRIAIDGVDDVQWTYFNPAPSLSVNGIQIGEPTTYGRRGFEAWDHHDVEAANMGPPRVSIFDSEGRVPLDLKRFRCGAGWKERFVPPIMQDIEKDFVAYCLVHAPLGAFEPSSRRCDRYEQAHSRWPYEPIRNTETGVPTRWGYCQEGSFHSGAIPLMGSAMVFVPLFRGGSTTARSIHLKLGVGQHVVIGDMGVGEEWFHGGWRLAWFARNVSADKLLIAPACVDKVGRNFDHELIPSKWNSITSKGASVDESQDVAMFEGLSLSSDWSGIVVVLRVQDRKEDLDYGFEWRARAIEEYLGEDPVIPYDDVERKEKFEEAYARLSAHVDTWEAERPAPGVADAGE